MIADYLEQARGELSRLDRYEIDRRTAALWGARAVIAWRLYKSTNDFAWYIYAIECRHEAIEHAAGARPGTVEELKQELKGIL